MIEVFNAQPLGGKFIFIGAAFAILAVLFVIITNALNRQGKPSAKAWRVLFIVSAVAFVISLGSGLLLLQFSDDGGEAPSQEQTESSSSVDDTVTIEAIYRDRKANELVADEKYDGNYYRITAKINGMETGGLLNITGGATLTMETKVDNTVVFFYAEFEKEQEEALKQVVVGDTITFEGKCYGGSFSDCKIVE